MEIPTEVDSLREKLKQDNEISAADGASDSNSLGKPKRRNSKQDGLVYLLSGLVDKKKRLLLDAHEQEEVLADKLREKDAVVAALQKEIQTLKETLKRKDGNLTFTTYRLVRAEELLNAYTVSSDDSFWIVQSPQKPISVLQERNDSRSSNNIAISPSREAFLVHYRKLTSVHTALLSSSSSSSTSFNGNGLDKAAPKLAHELHRTPYASSDSSISSTDTLTHSIATTTSTTSKHDTKSNNSSSSVRSSPQPQLSAPTPSSNAKQLLMGFLQGPTVSIESTSVQSSISSSGGSSRNASHSNTTMSKRAEELIHPKKANTPSRYAANTTPAPELDSIGRKDRVVGASKSNGRVALKCYSLDAEECTDVDTSIQDLEEDDRDDDTVVVDELVLEKYQKTSSSSSSSSSHQVVAVAGSSNNNISCVTSSVDGARSLERAYLQSNSNRNDPMKSLIKSFLLSNPGSSSNSSSTILPNRQQYQHPTFNVYPSSSSSAAPSQIQSSLTFHQHPVVPPQSAAAPRASSTSRSRSQPSVFDKLLANSRDSNNITYQRKSNAVNADMTTSFAETTTTATAVHSNTNRENIMWSSFPVRTTNASASAPYLKVPIADDVSVATAHNYNFSSNSVTQQREFIAVHSNKQPENFSSMSPNSFQGAILRMRAENSRIRTDIQRFKGTVEKLRSDIDFGDI
eukprot:gene29524-38632_t